MKMAIWDIKQFLQQKKHYWTQWADLEFFTAEKSNWESFYKFSINYTVLNLILYKNAFNRKVKYFIKCEFQTFLFLEEGKTKVLYKQKEFKEKMFKKN